MGAGALAKWARFLCQCDRCTQTTHKHMISFLNLTCWFEKSLRVKMFDRHSKTMLIFNRNWVMRIPTSISFTICSANNIYRKKIPSYCICSLSFLFGSCREDNDRSLHYGKLASFIILHSNFSFNKSGNWLKCMTEKWWCLRAHFCESHHTSRRMEFDDRTYK